MDIQQLRYFSVVYEECNYTHAAKRLFLSRQALRKAVQYLEREVGFPLFEARNNKLVPTSAGEALWEYSRPVLRTFADLERDVASLRHADSKSIVVGNSRGSNDVFTRDERMMFASMPKEDFAISARSIFLTGTCQEVRAKVLEGVADYGQLVIASIDDSLFDYEVAREGSVYALLREDDPLAAHDCVRIEDLKGRAFATQGAGFDVHDYIEASAADLGFNLNVVFTGGALSDLAYAVEAGMGVSYAYSSEGLPDVAPHAIARPFADKDFTWRYCSIAKKGMGDPFLLRYFAGKEIDWSFWDSSE